MNVYIPPPRRRRPDARHIWNGVMLALCVASMIVVMIGFWIITPP